jgi:ElaA protein
MPKIETEWQRFEALTADQLYELLRFRQVIFVVEQRSPYPDLDGLDQPAWHLAARVENKLAGYLRLMPLPGPPPVVRIGRVAVASDLRRQGLGRRLILEALQLHHEHYSTRDIALGAQAHLVPFYQSLGFETVGKPYDEFGVRHVEMSRRRGAALAQPASGPGSGKASGGPL